MPRASASFVCVLILAGACLAAEEKPSPKRPPPRYPKFTEKEVQGFVDEARPHVERLMQRKFKKIPPVVVDDVRAMAQILAEDMEPIIRHAYPDWKDDEVRRAAQTAGREQAQENLGKYGLRSGRLVILPSELAHVLDSHAIAPEHAAGILKTLIAHELLHALQAEQCDVLSLLSTARGDDEAAARNAMVEGQAMFVQEKVGEAMNLGDAARAYSRTFSFEEQEFPDPADRMVAARQAFLYIEGKRFVEWQYERGGAERLWEILAKPPTTTAMIARPASYRPEPPKPFEPECLAQFAAEFRKQGYTVTEQDQGEMDLWVAYAGAGRDDLNAVGEKIVAARSAVAQLPHSRGRVQINAYQLEGDSGKAVVDRFDKLVTASVAAYQKGDAIRARRFHSRPFVELDNARNYTLVLANRGGRTFLDRRIVIAARGKMVIEAVFDNHRMDPAEMKTLLERLLGEK